ncbi:MAG: type II toxin-antitoxin system ParD family antitoxin [Sphingomonas sp.]
MASKAVTVTLGEMGERAKRHVESGRFSSMSEVVRAGLRALDREEAALDEMLRVKIQEALDDPRPSIPIEEAFGRFWEKIEADRNG